MSKYRSTWSIVVGLAVAAATCATEHWRMSVAPTVSSIAAAVWAFVVTPFIDVMVRFARACVKLFLQPDWLVASLARLAHATRTAMKSWSERHETHYRAPGSWVACGST